MTFCGVLCAVANKWIHEFGQEFKYRCPVKMWSA